MNDKGLLYRVRINGQIDKMTNGKGKRLVDLSHCGRQRSGVGTTSIGLNHTDAAFLKHLILPCVVVQQLHSSRPLVTHGSGTEYPMLQSERSLPAFWKSSSLLRLLEAGAKHSRESRDRSFPCFFLLIAWLPFGFSPAYDVVVTCASWTSWDRLQAWKYVYKLWQP